MACSVGVGTYFFFQAFGTSKVQPWNYPDGKIPEEDTEPLRKDKTSQQDSPVSAPEG